MPKFYDTLILINEIVYSTHTMLDIYNCKSDPLRLLFDVFIIKFTF